MGAIGGSRISRYPSITVYNHDCCGIPYWSGSSWCDRCGSRAISAVIRVPLAKVMRQVHRADEPEPALGELSIHAEAVAPSVPSAPPQPDRPLPPAPTVSPTTGRPQAVQPHRCDNEGPSPSSKPPRSDNGSWHDTLRIALAASLALSGALLAAVLSVSKAPESVAPSLIALAAIAIAFYVPLTVKSAGRRVGNSSRAEG